MLLGHSEPVIGPDKMQRNYFFLYLQHCAAASLVVQEGLLQVVRELCACQESCNKLLLCEVDSGKAFPGKVTAKKLVFISPCKINAGYLSTFCGRETEK